MTQSKVSKFRFLVPSHGDGEGFLKKTSGNHLSHSGSDEQPAIVGSSSFTTFERCDDIKLYAKLPDWAVLIEGLAKRNSTLLLRLKAQFSRNSVAQKKMKKLSAASLTLRLWGKMFSLQTPIPLKNSPGNMCNPNGEVFMSDDKSEIGKRRVF